MSGYHDKCGTMCFGGECPADLEAWPKYLYQVFDARTFLAYTAIMVFCGAALGFVIGWALRG